MPPSKRPSFLVDEELGKKYDDHQPSLLREHLWQPKQWKVPRRRRMLLGFLILYLLYLFFKNMPTDLPPVAERLKANTPPYQQNPLQVPGTPSLNPLSNPPSQGDFNPENQDETYDENTMHFPMLGKSLRLFQKPPSRDGKVSSTATVFAAASLRSLSDMLPLACRMANQKLNEVHFLLMSGIDVTISIKGIQKVNGINSVNCPLNWHDARATGSDSFTAERLEQAVAVVLPYVSVYLHPQVVITQGESQEDPSFWKGIQKIRDLDLPHLALPRPSRDLMWMADLDSSALRVWNDVHVELLIYAFPDSAGSLIRLIRSLEHADFLGSAPSLTIELPSRVDQELLRFLKTLKWPSNTLNKVTIRRRIQLDYPDPTEASVRAVEAFYPRDLSLSHVLVLSPNIELAPSFYHYMMYTLLKYKYSARPNIPSSRLMGISLELPTARVTDTNPFTIPNIDNYQLSDLNNPDLTLPLFLWQAPNSNAALYFGDKWAEFHSFLSRRLAAQSMRTESLPNDKVISKRYPAFMEYLLELIRAKGYYLLYPAFPRKSKFSLASLHYELFQYPEEFPQDASSFTTSAVLEEEEEDPTELPLSRAPTVMSLLDMFSLELPDMVQLPIFSYRGEEMSEFVFARDTEEYLDKFRVRYGGCTGDLPNTMSAENLFCTEE